MQKCGGAIKITLFVMVISASRQRNKMNTPTNELENLLKEAGGEIIDMTPNPTPTTLREIMENLSSIIATNHLENGGGSLIGYQERRKYDDKHTDQATQAIQEQLKALLPAKQVVTENWKETASFDDAIEDGETLGINQAIDQIEKAIEEWAK
jgi:hypothetical protein